MPTKAPAKVIREASLLVARLYSEWDEFTPAMQAKGHPAMDGARFMLQAVLRAYDGDHAALVSDCLVAAISAQEADGGTRPRMGALGSAQTTAAYAWQAALAEKFAAALNEMSGRRT